MSNLIDRLLHIVNEVGIVLAAAIRIACLIAAGCAFGALAYIRFRTEADWWVVALAVNGAVLGTYVMATQFMFVVVGGGDRK